MMAGLSVARTDAVAVSEAEEKETVAVKAGMEDSLAAFVGTGTVELMAIGMPLTAGSGIT